MCIEKLRAEAPPAAGMQVEEVLPAGILKLAGSAQIKLAGVLLPQQPLDPKFKRQAARHEQTLQQLRSFSMGKKARYASKSPRDRHGRPVAQVFIGDGEWLQQSLITRGLARVEPETPGSACVAQLLQLEAAARRREAGFWSDSDVQVKGAWATRRLRRLENTFQIVSGKVAKVAESKRFTYINFGKDWRTDFTASIRSRTARRLTKAGLKLSALAGREVRIRGWITYRNGPMIEVTRAGQIEVLEKAKGPDD